MSAEKSRLIKEVRDFCYQLRVLDRKDVKNLNLLRQMSVNQIRELLTNLRVIRTNVLSFSLRFLCDDLGFVEPELVVFEEDQGGESSEESSEADESSEEDVYELEELYCFVSRRASFAGRLIAFHS